MNGRLIFAAGLLVGSTTGAVLTAAGLRDRPAPEPVESLAPAQQVERIPIDIAGVPGTCDLTYRDGRLSDITCAPDAEPATTEEPADG